MDAGAAANAGNGVNTAIAMPITRPINPANISKPRRRDRAPQEAVG